MARRPRHALCRGQPRPRLAAKTISTCLDTEVNAEDPYTRNVSELLDTTAPQYLAANPTGMHVYATRPTHIEVSFPVDEQGRPRDLHAVLQTAAEQNNQQQGNLYGFQLDESDSVFTFVPTSSHDAAGKLLTLPAPMSLPITLPRQTTAINEFGRQLAASLTAATGV